MPARVVQLIHVVCIDFVGVLLADGHKIKCDIVVAATGPNRPSFPFLPTEIRRKLEAEKDGTQLYRHVIHPDVPNLGFAGNNAGFVYIALVEISALWLSAVFSGELTLPSRDEMTNAIEYITRWKREHSAPESTLLCAVNMRGQQYADVMLKDLGVNPYRKMPNIFAEVFTRYGASDYATVVQEYQRNLQPKRVRAVSKFYT